MFNKAFAAPLAALALIAAAPPSAALASNDQPDNSSAQAQQSNSDTPKAERKICKNFEMTASHMRGQRLCLTRAQWREFYAAQEN